MMMTMMTIKTLEMLTIHSTYNENKLTNYNEREEIKISDNIAHIY